MVPFQRRPRARAGRFPALGAQAAGSRRATSSATPQSDAGLTGIYLPFWTYDCHTSSDYRGERGDDYYTTESYTHAQFRGRDRHADAPARSRRDWSAASGHVDHFHDDVLVMASTHAARGHRRGHHAWDLKALVPVPAGVRERLPGRGLPDRAARRLPDRQARPSTRRWRELVRRDIGGDQQRIHAVDTRYSDIKFKHVLLPVWLSAYRYRDKVYRFLINGQTGRGVRREPEVVVEDRARGGRSSCWSSVRGPACTASR